MASPQEEDGPLATFTTKELVTELKKRFELSIFIGSGPSKTDDKIDTLQWFYRGTNLATIGLLETAKFMIMTGADEPDEEEEGVDHDGGE